MLTFREEFGEFYALKGGEVVASGDAARNLYTGQHLFEKQLARRTRGSLLHRKPVSILNKEI